MSKRKASPELITGSQVDIVGPNASRVEVSVNAALAAVRIEPTGRNELREGPPNLNQPEAATYPGGSGQVNSTRGPGGQLVTEPANSFEVPGTVQVNQSTFGSGEPNWYAPVELADHVDLGGLPGVPVMPVPVSEGNDESAAAR